MTRERWKNLNGQWQFAAADEGEQPPFERSLDGRILVPFSPQSKLSGVWWHDRDESRMWYKRTFSAPDSWRIGTGGCPHGDDFPGLLLHFGAVDYQATVYVNGQQVATHKGGYDGFTVDVTGALKMRPNGKPAEEQQLVVGVYDPTDRGGQAIGKQRVSPGGIWYTSASGIWQTVRLEPVPKAHITKVQSTPKLGGRDHLRLTVHTDGATDEKVVATAYANGRRVSSVTGQPDTPLNLPMPNPKLWSPEHPFLYDLKVKLVDDHRPVDEVGSYFGMRSIGLKKVDGKLRPVLNGHFVFQIGPLDQGYWPAGIYTAPTDEAMKYDLVMTKKFGFNTVRKHVKVEPDRWYYYADKLGLLVWQDMPSMFPPGDTPNGAQAEEFEKELHQVVREHNNHPSIVRWAPFNEGWGEYDPARITNMVQRWDPSRLVDNNSGVNCCGSVDGGNGDVVDWHTYGGVAGFDSPRPTGERAAVTGEYGGLALYVPGHTWSGDGFGHGAVSSADELTHKYVEFNEKAERLMRRKGLSAAIYTQTTDVELELNGLMTYDRRVIKPDPQRVREANQALIDASRDLSSLEPEPPASDLTGVGFWPFDEGSGDVAHDAVGDHDAQLEGGPTWTDGHTGSALRFDGDNDSVDTGAAVLDTTGGYSVSAWVKLDDLNGFQTAVSQDGDTGSAFFLQYSDEDNRLAFSVTSGRALSDQAPQAGKWYHLVGASDLDGIKLYVDGQLADEEPYCSCTAMAGHTVIGRAKYDGDPVDFWHGSLDQVHVYKHPMTAEQVRQLYQSGR